jgi:hypothetical protein
MSRADRWSNLSGREPLQALRETLVGRGYAVPTIHGTRPFVTSTTRPGVPIASVETIVVMKLLAGRTQDLANVEAIVVYGLEQVPDEPAPALLRFRLRLLQPERQAEGAARLLEGRDVLLARHAAPGEAQGKGGEGQVAPDHDSRSERLLPDRGAEKLQGLRQ